MQHPSKRQSVDLFVELGNLEALIQKIRETWEGEYPSLQPKQQANIDKAAGAVFNAREIIVEELRNRKLLPQDE